MSGGIDLERRYTLADLDDFPEDGRRFELADGWLLVLSRALSTSNGCAPPATRPCPSHSRSR